MVLSYAELCGRIDIYEREYKQYTKCLCRGIEVLMSNEPEELVRQALLYYLLHESGLYPGKIAIKVEYKDLDVAIYGCVSDSDFQPFTPPSVIIEVKRTEADLLNHVGQLCAYLKEQSTNVGVLFNGRNILALENYMSETPLKCQLRSLDDLRALILRAVDCGQDESRTALFQRARGGDVDGFIDLIGIYGKRALNQITFKLKTSPELIVGCFFRIDGQVINYEIYGKYSRKKKLKFHRDEFDKLLSVTY
jgi:hypothetical protein